MNIGHTTLFHEEQHFKRPWLMVLLLLLILLPIGILVFITMQQQLSEMELVLSVIVIIVFEIPIFIFFYYTKLETRVTNEGFGYRWWPLQKKFRMLFKHDIVEIRIRQSPAFTYGYHWKPGYGWVNNVRGSMGFQIKLKSGKKLFIGSQKMEQLKTALEKLLNIRIGDFRNEF